MGLKKAALDQRPGKPAAFGIETLRSQGGPGAASGAMPLAEDVDISSKALHDSPGHSHWNTSKGRPSHRPLRLAHHRIHLAGKCMRSSLPRKRKCRGSRSVVALRATLTLCYQQAVHGLAQQITNRGKRAVSIKCPKAASQRQQHHDLGDLLVFSSNNFKSSISAEGV